MFPNHTRRLFTLVAIPLLAAVTMGCGAFPGFEIRVGGSQQRQHNPAGSRPPGGGFGVPQPANPYMTAGVEPGRNCPETPLPYGYPGGYPHEQPYGPPAPYHITDAGAW